MQLIEGIFEIDFKATSSLRESFPIKELPLTTEAVGTPLSWQTAKPE